MTRAFVRSFYVCFNRWHHTDLRGHQWLLWFVLVCTPLLAFAQEANPDSAAAEATSVAANSESGQENTPADASEQQNGEPPAEALDLGLGEIIDTAVLSEDWAKSLNNLLDQYGLSASFVGQAIASFIVIIVFLVIYYILRKIVHNTFHRIKNSVSSVNVSFKRTNLYLTLLNTLLFLLLTCLMLMLLSGIWSTNAQEGFLYPKASGAFQFLATFAFLALLGILAFEGVSAVMERLFAKWSDHGSPRVQTLLPIARNVVNVALFIVLGITLISELGINVMPLLAGAGVIGFAIGFGAQTIIKDLITGFIIIFEDLVQVGDVVTVGGKSGLVEKITIRKIQLRGLDGTVITVPFSEITIVDNMTKEFSYYLMNVGVAYRENTDEVIKVLKAIGEEMQNDDDFKTLILEPIDILGVDAFADSAVIIKARIKTLPIKQWAVGREFNRRMKMRFDEVGIEIPFPHQTLYFGEGKQGEAPPAHIVLEHSASANDEDLRKKTSSSPAQHSAADSSGYKADEDDSDGEEQS